MQRGQYIADVVLAAAYGLGADVDFDDAVAVAANAYVIVCGQFQSLWDVDDDYLIYIDDDVLNDGRLWAFTFFLLFLCF